MNFKFCIFFLIFISTSLSSFAQQHSVKTDPDQTLQEYADSVIQPSLQNSEIAGSVVGVAKNDSIIFLKSYGYSDVDAKIPMSSDAIFPIASVTKPFTALAVMQLKEDGLIRLDDTINHYIPFGSLGDQVTIRQLLNHTSGIKDYTETDIPAALNGTDFSRDTVAQLLKEKEPDFEPGYEMDYSNSGYYLLGLIIENVSGMTYEQYLKENIFAPVGLEDTYNCYENDHPERRVKGYRFDGQKNLTSVNTIDFQVAFAAGSMCSSASDLLDWSITLNHQQKLLSTESYREMITPSLLHNGRPIRYGLGLQTDRYFGNEVIHHHGIMDGFLSDIRYFPSDDITIVTLINTLGPVKPANVSNSLVDYFIEHQEVARKYQGELTLYEGSYTGTVMGNNLPMVIKAIDDSLTAEIAGKSHSLSYIGNEKWMDEEGYIYLFSKSKPGIIQVNAPLMSIIFKKNQDQ